MNRTLLLLLGVAALGGGAWYLYRSGQMVANPSMASSAGPVYMGPVQRLKLNLPNVSGYYW